ncbi:MAG: pilus assembly protein, partial [Salinarimonadaceae bacterium]
MQIPFSRAVRRKISSQLRRLRKREDGNVAMMFALMLLPFIAAVGGAVDYAMASAARAEFQRLVDAASLTGATRLQQTSLTQAEIAADLKEYVRSRLPNQIRLDEIDIRFSADGRAITVEVDYGVRTNLIRVVKIESIDGRVISEARASDSTADVSVALDLTGSMREHIAALRVATRELVNILKPPGVNTDSLRIALVPYVTTVNVSGHPQHMGWMDVNGLARYHGENFANVHIQDRRCDPPPAPPPPPPPPGPPPPPPPPPSP